MATHINERVPVRIVSQGDSSNGDASELQLQAERSMGVLRHPVARAEMLRKIGIDRRGCKVVLHWDNKLPENLPIKAGDHLDIAGTLYSIIGVKAYPGFYIDVFIEDL